MAGVVGDAITGNWDFGNLIENAAVGGLSAGLTTGFNLAMFGTGSTNSLLPGGQTLTAPDPLLPGGTLTSALGLLRKSR